MAADPPQLIVRDAAAWRTWLAENVDEQAGVWLVLAKKGTMEPTTLSYAAALEEALCHGWIDGQARRRDEGTYVQRFTPRRRRSMWSQRNVGLVERLTAEGRMHPHGLSEMARAKADGRWEAAYAGPATAEIPADLTEALAARPEAQAMFENLTSQNRFAVLHRLGAAKRQETRARRIEQYVDVYPSPAVSLWRLITQGTGNIGPDAMSSQGPVSSPTLKGLHTSCTVGLVKPAA